MQRQINYETPSGDTCLNRYIPCIYVWFFEGRNFLHLLHFLFNTCPNFRSEKLKNNRFYFLNMLLYQCIFFKNIRKSVIFFKNGCHFFFLFFSFFFLCDTRFPSLRNTIQGFNEIEQIIRCLLFNS